MLLLAEACVDTVGNADGSAEALVQRLGVSEALVDASCGVGVIVAHAEPLVEAVSVTLDVPSALVLGCANAVCDGDGVGRAERDMHALTEVVAHCDAISERVSAALGVTLVDALWLSDTDAEDESEAHSVELTVEHWLCKTDGLGERDGVSDNDNVAVALRDAVRDARSTDESALSDAHGELEMVVDVDAHTELVAEKDTGAVGDTLREVVSVADADCEVLLLVDSDAEPVTESVTVALNEMLGDPVDVSMPRPLRVAMGARLSVLRKESVGAVVTVADALRNALGDPNGDRVALPHDDALSVPVDEAQKVGVVEADCDALPLLEVVNDETAAMEAAGLREALRVPDCEGTTLALCDALRTPLGVLVAHGEEVPESERAPESVAGALRVNDKELVALSDIAALADSDAVSVAVCDTVLDDVTVAVGLQLGNALRDGVDDAVLQLEAVTDADAVLLELCEAFELVDEDDVTLASPADDADAEVTVVGDVES